MTTDMKPWDVECDASKAAIERFMRALLVVRGHFTCAFSLGDVSKPSRGVTVFYRVWIPIGMEARFVELAKCPPLTAPPRVQVGFDSRPHDTQPIKRVEMP